MSKNNAGARSSASPGSDRKGVQEMSRAKGLSIVVVLAMLSGSAIAGITFTWSSGNLVPALAGIQVNWLVSLYEDVGQNTDFSTLTMMPDGTAGGGGAGDQALASTTLVGGAPPSFFQYFESTASGAYSQKRVYTIVWDSPTLAVVGPTMFGIMDAAGPDVYFDMPDDGGGDLTGVTYNSDAVYRGHELDNGDTGWIPVVPEPTTFALLALGTLVAAGRRFRRR